MPQLSVALLVHLSELTITTIEGENQVQLKAELTEDPTRALNCLSRHANRKAGPACHRESKARRRSTPLRSAFTNERELFAKKKILRYESRMNGKEQPDEREHRHFTVLFKICTGPLPGFH
jgi:hypothetical protein